MNIRHISLAVFCTLLCFLFVGCGSSASFTWKLSRVPSNLDPQIASESPELIAVTNLYRGLTRIDESGEPVLDCAESYTVSADGCTYTFTLKDGLSYTKLKRHEKEYDLTAQDFVFGMQRVFMPETNSPYSSTFLNIKNAKQVLNGTMSPDQLGVSAPDEHTVVFQLEQPDSEFLAKLSQAGAMPCNQEFFENSGGAYGLTAQYTLANGSFYLYNWNENGLFLRRSTTGNQIGNLRLVIDTDTASSSSSSSGSTVSSTSPSGVQKVLDGIATAAIDNASAAGKLSSIPYTATTWALVFNCENPQLAPIDVRKALISSAVSASFELPTDFSVAEGLLPPAITLNGESYRSQAGNQLPDIIGNSKDLCRTGLESAGLKRFDNIQILIPQGSSYRELMDHINQTWQQDLGSFSAYFSIKELPLDELLSAVTSGNYQIALIPFTVTSNNPLELLSQFSNGAITFNTIPTYDTALTEATSSLELSATDVAALEHQLLTQAGVYPLWYQQQALILAQGVEHVVFHPFGPILDLTWATYTK